MMEASGLSLLVRMASQPVRAPYYRVGRGAAVVRRLPPWVAGPLGLDDAGAVGSRRMQVGQLPAVLPGFLHCDDTWRHPHLEIRSPPWRMRMQGGTLDDIVAIGVLDRLAPADVLYAVGHWRRLLRGLGRLVVGVADAGARLPDAATPQELWGHQPGAPAAAGGSAITSPLQLPRVRRARTAFNRTLLAHVLDCAGFDVVEVLGSSGAASPHPGPLAWNDLEPLDPTVLAAADLVAVCRPR